MRVAARQGKNVYLISAVDDLEAAAKLPRPVGRVLDLDLGILFAPFNMHSIIARGGWEAAELPDAELRSLLAGVEIRGPGIDEPWELPTNRAA